MMTKPEALADVLSALDDITVAVSGGVDSVTLACFAHRLLGGERVYVVHAASPAVPADAQPRIRQLATQEGWNLDVVGAGEFDDPNYKANPINRCFYCKTNLYRTLVGLRHGRTVVSGTNCDDLGDYRPGLIAARDFAVRHPFVEAGLCKQDVRQLASDLSLPEFAALPASPCLSSRVETGLAIDADQLALIDAIETWLKQRLSPETVRCRVRRRGIVIELDAAAHAEARALGQQSLLNALRGEIGGLGGVAISWANYARGSAFVGDRGKEA